MVATASFYAVLLGYRMIGTSCAPFAVAAASAASQRMRRCSGTGAEGGYGSG